MLGAVGVYWVADTFYPGGKPHQRGIHTDDYSTTAVGELCSPAFQSPLNSQPWKLPSARPQILHKTVGKALSRGAGANAESLKTITDTNYHAVKYELPALILTLSSSQKQTRPKLSISIPSSIQPQKWANQSSSSTVPISTSWAPANPTSTAAPH